MRTKIVGYLDDSPFIDPWGIKVIQSNHMGLKPGREIVLACDPSYSSDSFPVMVMIPATRPSIHFPLTEALAAEHGIDLWYFDPEKWPDRIVVNPSEYLGIPESKHA